MNHPISEVVDSVERALENAHRGLAVARDAAFAAEGGLLALRALDVATKTLRAAMKGETVADEPVDEKPEPKPEPKKPPKPRKGTASPRMLALAKSAVATLRELHDYGSPGLRKNDVDEKIAALVVRTTGVAISRETIRKIGLGGYNVQHARCAAVRATVRDLNGDAE